MPYVPISVDCGTKLVTIDFMVVVPMAVRVVAEGIGPVVVMVSGPAEEVIVGSLLLVLMPVPAWLVDETSPVR